jgi:hypothetical protein
MIVEEMDSASLRFDIDREREFKGIYDGLVSRQRSC